METRAHRKNECGLIRVVERPTGGANSWPRRLITCALLGALINLALPSPLDAAYVVPYQDPSVKNAIVEAVVLIGGTIAVVVICHRFRSELKLQAWPRLLDFRSATPGATIEQTVRLRAKGHGTLVITGVSLSGDCLSLLKSPQAPLPLSASETTGIVIGFTAQPGACSGRLEVETKGGKKGAGMLLVPLQGRGLQ